MYSVFSGPYIICGDPEPDYFGQFDTIKEARKCVKRIWNPKHDWFAIVDESVEPNKTIESD